MAFSIPLEEQRKAGFIRMKDPIPPQDVELKARVVEISNENSSDTVVAPDLEDNQKRWLIVGICLQKVVSPALRKYIPQTLKRLYTSLNRSDRIDVQTNSKHLKVYKSQTLQYESINNNKVKGKRNQQTYDFRVRNEVDFSKLFLLPHMAQYTGFNETCDASALLGIIINIDQFPDVVQSVAKQLRSKIRNPWAHCDFSEWDTIKYQEAFQLMQQLIRNLTLPKKQEEDILEEVTKWQINGFLFIHGPTPGLELVRLIKNETQSLAQYILSIESHTGENLDKLGTEISRIETAFEAVSTAVQYVRENQDVLKKDTVKLKKKTEELDSDISSLTSKVGGIEINQVDYQNAVETDMQRIDEDIGKVKQHGLQTEEKVDELEGRLQETNQEMNVLKKSFDETLLYLSPSRPKDKMFFYPPDRIGTFVGREREMKTLQDTFWTTSNDHCTQVICGLGGIGKTTLSIEYAWKYQNLYPGGVFWMSAETNEALEDSFKKLAAKADTFGSDTKETLHKTLNWLSLIPKKWLLVIDNVDCENVSGSTKEILLGAWRRNTNGHMIITSRREAADAEEAFQVCCDHCIPLTVLSYKESIHFMITRTGLPYKESDLGLTALIEELGGLPLALEQAAAHIKSIKCSFQDYNEKFQRKKLKLLKANRPSYETTKERLAVLTTWQLNFDYIQRQSEEDGLGTAAVTVMEISAFLYADSIPLQILNTGQPDIPDEDLLDALGDNLGAKQIVEILTRFSLFQQSDEQEMRVHRLVQEVIRGNISDPNHKNLIFQCAARMIHQALAMAYSPSQVLKKENTATGSLLLWSKLALNANALRIHLFDKKVKVQCKDVCFSLETSKMLQASAIYHSLYQRQDQALAAQDQMIHIITAIDITEEKCRELTCIKIPLLEKQRLIIQRSMTALTGFHNELRDNESNTIQSLSNLLREKGNAAFKAQMYRDAIQFYSEAIRVSSDAVDPKLYSNRTIAYFKSQEYEKALVDANSCIKLDPEACKAYYWKAMVIPEMIRNGQLSETWRSVGLAAASVAINFDEQRCMTKMRLEYPLINYILVKDQSKLDFILNPIHAVVIRVVLLCEGRYNFWISPKTCFVKSLQIIGVEKRVEICMGSDVHSLILSSYSTEKSHVQIYFENIIFVSGTSQIQVKINETATFFNCMFSNGQLGCEDYPHCKGDSGCVNKGPKGCNIHKSFGFYPYNMCGQVGYPGIVAEDGGKVLLDNCLLDRCGGGGALSDGKNSLLVIKNSIVRNMRQMGVEARNNGAVIVEQCLITGNKTHGVAVGPNGNGCIKSNIIRGNGQEGIWSGGLEDDVSGSKCSILDNVICQNNLSGISCGGGFYEVSGNRIFENWSWGMMIKSRSDIYILNNDIFENKCGGIRIGMNYSATVIMDGNTVRDHPGPGLYALTSLTKFIPNMFQGDAGRSMAQNMKSAGMIVDEIAMFTNAPIKTSRNLFQNNDKTCQHPMKVLDCIKTCCYCHCMSDNFRHCAKCKKALYCSNDCQVNHWERHKHICKLLSNTYKIEIKMEHTKRQTSAKDMCGTDGNIIRTFAPLPGIGEGSPPDRTSTKAFIVKVQSGREYGVYDPMRDISLYDQSLDLDICFKNPSLYLLVVECGVLASNKLTTKKIFCWASFQNQGKVLCIHAENLPPFQTW